MSEGAVGYLLREYPRPSETFVASELLELERAGLPLRIFSYRHPASGPRHEVFRQIASPVTYLPDPLNRHAGALLAANPAAWRASSVRYRRTLRYVLGHMARESSLDTARRFLQAVYLARLVGNSDVRHLHAHFARGPARVAMLAGMLTGLPYSFTAHARDIYTNDIDLGLLREKIARARFVVTVSEDNRAYLEDKIGASGNVRVVYNGVNTEKFSPDPAIERADDTILSVGRMVEKKGLPVLIEAVRLLRERGSPVRCELAGDGDERSRLEEHIRKAGLVDTISFLGPRTQEELPMLYRRATVFAMPAVVAADGNRDALPTVLLEAMACGAPAVASRLGGIPEIIDHGVDGLLVEPGDAAGLARTIECLFGDRELRERLGAAARAKVLRRFDIRQNVRALHELFRESLAAPERVPA